MSPTVPRLQAFPLQASHTAGRRVGAAALLLLVLTLCSGCAERLNAELYRSLPEVEANRLVAFLDTHAIKAIKQTGREGVAVLVASSSLAAAARLTTEAGLPREQYKGLGAVFQKDGLVSSPLEERARLMFALSQQIEAMLRQIDGVVEAKVSVVLPERRPGRSTELPSAAVVVKHDEALDTTLLGWKIQRMVASSVPGLIEGDTRQISLSFIPSASLNPSLIATPISDLAPKVAPAEEPGSAEIVWTWQRLLPIAALATMLIGLGLLWLRQSDSDLARNLRSVWHRKPSVEADR